MSGTSVDGIDISASHFYMKRGFIKHKLISASHFKFPEKIRRKIFSAMSLSDSSVSIICELNFELAHIYAKAVDSFLQKSKIKREDVYAIGSHGQTIWHIPRGILKNGNLITPSTLQLGDGSVIAELTGITTVSDFRPRDIAAGGHGAPLVPFADYHLFTHKKKNRIIQNIGGISNSTYLKAGGCINDIIAFDNGPGNMMLDYAVSVMTNGKARYDKDGRFSRCGIIIAPMLSHLLSHPYLKITPPKSTGREMFGAYYTDKIITQYKNKGFDFHDIISTLAYFTAHVIADSYQKFILPANQIDEIILTGGGAFNKTIVSHIERSCPHAKVMPISEFDIEPSVKESLSFAMLAYAAMNNIPNNVPSATGAQKQAILGKISPGRFNIFSRK